MSGAGGFRFAATSASRLCGSGGGTAVTAARAGDAFRRYSRLRDLRRRAGLNESGYRRNSGLAKQRNVLFSHPAVRPSCSHAASGLRVLTCESVSIVRLHGQDVVPASRPCFDKRQFKRVIRRDAVAEFVGKIREHRRFVGIAARADNRPDTRSHPPTARGSRLLFRRLGPVRWAALRIPGHRPVMANSSRFSDRICSSVIGRWRADSCGSRLSSRMRMSVAKIERHCSPIQHNCPRPEVTIPQSPASELRSCRLSQSAIRS